MKKVIKRVSGGLLVISAIVLGIYGFSQQLTDGFWASGGEFSMSAFLMGLGSVLLFDGKIEDIF